VSCINSIRTLLNASTRTSNDCATPSLTALGLWRTLGFFVIREGKSPDYKKNSAFSTKFFANFHYFCVLFPSSRRNSTKPQHLSMRYYIAKQLSGINFYILQQSHVMHQLVLLNLVVIHIIIVVTHETIDGQPGHQYIISFGLAYGSGQPFSLAHSTT
jgi:hypothetical protein